jgi:hypothetical protein
MDLSEDKIRVSLKKLNDKVKSSEIGNILKEKVFAGIEHVKFQV